MKSAPFLLVLLALLLDFFVVTQGVNAFNQYKKVRTRRETAQSDCWENEHYVTCGPEAKCEPSCANRRNPPNCRQPHFECAFPRCVCNDGYIRGPNRRCIRLDECTDTAEEYYPESGRRGRPSAHGGGGLVEDPSRERFPSSRDVVCHANEVYHKCGKDCEKTCVDILSGRANDACNCVNHRGGCICKEGYGRATDQLPCVPHADCSQYVAVQPPARPNAESEARVPPREEETAAEPEPEPEGRSEAGTGDADDEVNADRDEAESSAAEPNAAEGKGDDEAETTEVDDGEGTADKPDTEDKEDSTNEAGATDDRAAAEEKLPTDEPKAAPEPEATDTEPSEPSGPAPDETEGAEGEKDAETGDDEKDTETEDTETMPEDTEDAENTEEKKAEALPTDDERSCKKNERWVDCRAGCEPSCEHVLGIIAACPIGDCTPRCTCKKGYVRWNGTCIEKSRCDTSVTTVS